ncbi:transposase [Candidatus Poribacteria bacterium]|nr:transposase [Candidatus Poribacteria bacterium]MYB67154.1 transposase [Gemmatimonadota bacterium]
MVEYTGEITEAQWAKIEPLLPTPPRSPNGGRTRIPDRAVFEGILWVLRSGARWRDLPSGYPSASTCWRRLQEWQEAEVWLSAWRAFLGQLDAQGQLDWHEVFADGAFAGAKKGGPWSEKPNHQPGLFSIRHSRAPQAGIQRDGRDNLSYQSVRESARQQIRGQRHSALPCPFSRGYH